MCDRRNDAEDIAYLIVSLRNAFNNLERKLAQERNAAKPLEDAVKEAFITAIDRVDGGCHARTDSMKARPAFHIRGNTSLVWQAATAWHVARR